MLHDVLLRKHNHADKERNDFNVSIIKSKLSLNKIHHERINK